MMMIVLLVDQTWMWWLDSAITCAGIFAAERGGTTGAEAAAVALLLLAGCDAIARAIDFRVV